MVLRTRSSRALSQTAASVWEGSAHGTRAPSPSEWTGTLEGPSACFAEARVVVEQMHSQAPQRVHRYDHGRSRQASRADGACIERAGARAQRQRHKGLEHESESARGRSMTFPQLFQSGTAAHSLAKGL